jgi:hypothetical protein
MGRTSGEPSSAHPRDVAFPFLDGEDDGGSHAAPSSRPQSRVAGAPAKLEGLDGAAGDGSRSAQPYSVDLLADTRANMTMQNADLRQPKS